MITQDGLFSNSLAGISEGRSRERKSARPHRTLAVVFGDKWLYLGGFVGEHLSKLDKCTCFRSGPRRVVGQYPLTKGMRQPADADGYEKRTCLR